MSLKEDLTQLREQALVRIDSATSLKELNEARVKELGKKGALTEVFAWYEGFASRRASRNRSFG